METTDGIVAKPLYHTVLRTVKRRAKRVTKGKIRPSPGFGGPDRYEILSTAHLRYVVSGIARSAA